MSLYKEQLNQWKASLNVKARVVFDIGGSQSPIKGMTNSWDVEDYKIVDLATPHVEVQRPDFAHDMNEPLYDEFYQVKNTSIPDTYIGSVDLIFCLGVFDYVIEPGIAMRNIAWLLNDNGSAWIEFPLFYGHHEPLYDEGCRYSEGCITRLVAKAGVNIAEIIRKPAGNEYLLKFMQTDGQRLSKNYQYHNTVGFIVRVTK